MRRIGFLLDDGQLWKLPANTKRVLLRKSEGISTDGKCVFGDGHGRRDAVSISIWGLDESDTWEKVKGDPRLNEGDYWLIEDGKIVEEWTLEWPDLSTYKPSHIVARVPVIDNNYVTWTTTAFSVPIATYTSTNWSTVSSGIINYTGYNIKGDNTE